MALIFPRLAQNFIKNGYFPTDEISLERILGALDVDGGNLRIADPCCGEGTALAEIRQHLQSCGSNTSAFGVEFDAERAWHAKTLLDRVAHADIADVFATARSFGLLFLNPPYGHVVTDKAGTGDRNKSDRLEKVFFRRTLSWLQFGGVLVLIVPHYVLDTEFATLIARNFSQVKAFMAPEQRFKQCIVFGVKQRSDAPDPKVVKELEAIGTGVLPEVIPEQWSDLRYLVPAVPTEDAFAFNSIRIEGKQLCAELEKMGNHTLWPQFHSVFTGSIKAHRRPLRDLSKWHLALALAAGQICGVVQASDGRKMLIKGDTFKGKNVVVETAEDKDGNIRETRVATDTFIPMIKGIDFTPGPTFGEIITIR